MDISRQSQARIDDLKAMPTAAQFEKIAMNIKNPQIYQQFMAAEDSAEIADYAYAAGLISKADADFIKAEETEENEGGEGGEESTSNVEPTILEPNESPGQA